MHLNECPKSERAKAAANVRIWVFAYVEPLDSGRTLPGRI
jgi:hypothetical protein